MRRTALASLLLLPSLALAQALAITDVTVVDATGAAPRPGMTVLIREGRIAAIDKKIVLPRNTQVVSGKEKFVIPGLWDMHVHWRDPAYLALFTANGVTGIRVMWGEPYHLDMRRRVAAGELVGPRMALAGTIVDGPKPFWKESIAAATPVDGRQAVQRTRIDGYDFVKVYNFVPREVFFAIADEAKKLNLPLSGHVPNAVTVAEASDAGLKSVEHLIGMLLAVSSREAELRREIAAASRLPEPAERGALLARLGAQVQESYDAATAAALYEKFKANGTWQVPTFTVLRVNANLLEPGHAADPRLRFMPAWVRTMWSGDPRFRNPTPAEVARQQKLFERRLALVGEMHRAGVGILAGSDVLNPYVFPGSSLHEELEWLVKAGLSPMAALQAATRSPAAYLGRLKDLGTVEPGKIADLVLLDADPTQDIRNTRKIAAVVAGGKLFLERDLQQMLAGIERLAGTN